MLQMSVLDRQEWEITLSSKNHLGHGVPENVSSAYAKSAHILPAVQADSPQHTEKGKDFHEQPAKRYVENLTIWSAFYDMQQDDLARLSASEDSNTPGWKLWEQRYTITWPAGHACPTFQWFRPSPGDHPDGDSLQEQVMHHLGQQVLPYILDEKLVTVVLH
jgi:hypothetical protein